MSPARGSEADRPRTPADARDRRTLVEAIRPHLDECPEILFACLHGSYQTGGASRDVDVGVWVDPGREPARGWLRYALDLSVSLHLALRVPVDVQVLNAAPLAFRYHALKGEPLFVRDWELFYEVRART
jgi:predicted nucleotidyltransferase